MLTHFDRESSLELIRLIEDLPSLPHVYSEIQAVIHDPHSDAADLAAIVSTDQATSAMILKCVNSVRHNPSGKPIADLTKAIARIGFADAANIAASMSLLYGFALPMGMRYIRSFWSHAYAVGLFSKVLAPHFQLNKEEMFTLGLLHDCGRIVLGLRVDMDYFESELGRLDSSELAIAETKSYGIDHAEAGSELLKLWGFPENVQRAVRDHLDEATDFLPAKIVLIANREAHARISPQADMDEIESEYLPAFLKDIPDIIESLNIRRL
ncbi:MAG: HDOD domain-containing protein [Mariprofundaceae bacterium]